MAGAFPQGAEATSLTTMTSWWTEMGKSTTSDKLIMADLDGHSHHQAGQCSNETVCVERIKLGDFNMWLISDAEDELECVTVRLKNLMMFQGLPKPHEGVNSLYEGSKKPTSRSQLISNESTKVRVLEFPDFSGKMLVQNVHKLREIGSPFPVSLTCVTF